MFQGVHLIIIASLAFIVALIGFIGYFRKTVENDSLNKMLLAANLLAAIASIVVISALFVKIPLFLTGAIVAAAVHLIVVICLYTIVMIKAQVTQPAVIAAMVAALGTLIFIAALPTFNVLKYCVPVIKREREKSGGAAAPIFAPAPPVAPVEIKEPAPIPSELLGSLVPAVN